MCLKNQIRDDAPKKSGTRVQWQKVIRYWAYQTKKGVKEARFVLLCYVPPLRQ